MADLPDKIAGGFIAEPCLQHIADTEPLILTSEEAPRALQPALELHKAFLIVFYVHHIFISTLIAINLNVNYSLMINYMGQLHDNYMFNIDFDK